MTFDRITQNLIPFVLIVVSVFFLILMTLDYFKRRKRYMVMLTIQKRIMDGDIGPMPDFNPKSGTAIYVPVGNCRHCIARFDGDRATAIHDGIEHQRESGHTVQFNPPPEN